MKDRTKKELPLLQPKSRTAWRAWLAKNHASSTGIWLVYAKKHTGIPSLTYNDAVEEALCYGWIDSLVHSIDEDLFKQIFTPRKATSAWSALNKTRVERLIAGGLMTPSGTQMIDVAKESGRWDTHQASETLTVPPELKKAFAANAQARKNWPTYTVSQQKALLRMVTGAQRPETRATRVARVIDIVSQKMSFSQLVKESMTGKKKTPTRRTKPTKI